jgi:hypothetical protein
VSDIKTVVRYEQPSFPQDRVSSLLTPQAGLIVDEDVDIEVKNDAT